MALKEYLYLDTKYLNSSLAQLGEGLMTSQHSGSETLEENGGGETNEVNGGVSNFLHLGITLEKKATSEADHKIGNSTQEVIDSVLDDYAVQILQKHLKNEIITDMAFANEGDFIKFTSPFRIYDFTFLSSVLAPDNMQLIRNQGEPEKEIQQLQQQIKSINNLKGKQKTAAAGEKYKLQQQLNKLKSEQDTTGWDNIKTVSDIAKFFNQTFPDSIIIKMNHCLLYCDRNFFRENSTQLSMLVTSKRDMTVFGSVMSVTKSRNNDEPFNKFEANELNVIPALMSTIMLSNFGMLDKDKTLLIRPIAISFD